MFAPLAYSSISAMPSLVGAWPLEQERALAYAEKAIREAKSRTSWTNPQKDYEEAVMRYIRGLYGDQAFLDELGHFTDELSLYGHQTSLAQTLLKLTAPGIPDFYQGTELWNFSLVDPDNRRPVDYERRKRLLHEVETLSPEAIWERRADGLPKLWIIRQGLRLRRQRPHVFGASADYLPLYARGEKSAHVVSFLRAGEVVSIASRLSLQLGNAWNETTVELPAGRWRQELDGQTFDGGVCLLRNILRTFPVALLSKVL